MVVKKRQYYGFNGFHMPPIPRAPRSARGRGLNKKKVEDNQICAFELLASLAGKILQESESSASSNASQANDVPIIGGGGGGGGGVKREQDEDRPLKVECLDHGSCGESAFVTEFTSPNSDQKCLLNEFPHAESDSILERSSMITNSNSSGKAATDLKSVICKSKSACENFHGKVEGSSDSRLSCDGYADNGLSRQQGGDGGLPVDNPCSSKDSMEMGVKFHSLINSDDNVELPSCRDPVPNASSQRHRNDTKLGIRDDDENFSRCNKPLTKPKPFRPPQRIGDCRIRKLLTSKYWKIAPKLKDYELSKPAFLEGGMKPNYRKRKLCYSRERYKCVKRKKFADRSVVMTSDGGFSSESVCNSPEKNMTGDKNGSTVMFHGENGVSSSVIDHHASFHSKDSHVKFSIKSFRVPELFIEVPETATVGSLKRTVVEAVSAILGGGLRVGVLLHGRKVRDDNRTLLQTGITSNENLDTLGFSLEPTPVQVPPPLCADDPPAVLPCDTSELMSRSPTTPIVDSGMSDALPVPPPFISLDTNIESNHEPVSSHTDLVTDSNTQSDSRAIVAVPPMNAEALNMVPLNQKSKRSELVQRRTRRPFSVSEVDALVHAVEELGTGRWRDVKLRSFEDADHRTYVDLKDKWKTLVHTAQIAPQQRRGEPVPQDLLDRVLAAHGYWSQHQAKQHCKNQTAILKITDTHAVRNGVEEGIHSM